MQAISIIDERYTDDTLTQAKVAEQVGLHAPDLSAQFRRSTGFTFTEYLRDVRLDAGALLLRTTDRRIKEIWVAVGYNDASNFDHQFKERFGTSPRDYRSHASSSVTQPPAAHAQSRAPSATQHEPLTDRGAVLIVEDYESTRETIGRYLRLNGYEVVLTATGHEGLQEAQRIEPHVVVLDYHLPDMDGLTWLRALRQHEHGRRPGVLLFTADWDVANHADEIRTLGATFTSKLCDLEDIDRLVASLVRLSLLQFPSVLPKTSN